VCHKPETFFQLHCQLANSTDPELKKCVARLQSGGSRMAHIIDELFDLARARLAAALRSNAERPTS